MTKKKSEMTDEEFFKGLFKKINKGIEESLKDSKLRREMWENIKDMDSEGLKPYDPNKGSDQFYDLWYNCGPDFD